MPANPQKIAFLGTGNMGEPLARLLLDDGHDITIWNRTAAKLQPLLNAGARAAASPADVVRDVDIVFSVLGGDESVEQVLLKDAAIDAMRRGAVHVSITTISPALSERLTRAHKQRGSEYLALPVFGRPETISARQLWLVAGGPRDVFERLRPLLERLGRGLTYVGEVPAQANLVKVGGNFLIAAMLESLGESFALMERNGLKPDVFLEVMNRVFRSPVYERYGAMMIANEVEPAAFSMKWGLKDVSLVQATAAMSNTPMPIADVLHQHFLASVARGRGELDWLAVGWISRELAGLPLPARRDRTSAA